MSRFRIPAEDRVANFFSQASVTQAECDAKALTLTTGPITPVLSQGRHSYTLYATPSQDQIIQFRLASHFTDLDNQTLAENVYGDLVPKVSFEGEFGEDDQESGREPVCVYLMHRIPGVTQLEFMSSSKLDSKDEDFTGLKKNFAADITRLLALSKTSPQTTTEAHRTELKSRFFDDLQILVHELPTKFQPVIETCIASLDDILALPLVLQYSGPNESKVLVHPETGKVTGILDWSEAKVLPLGMKLHTMETLAAHVALPPRNSKSTDHEHDQQLFWEVLMEEYESLGKAGIQTIKKAGALGVLIDSGFTWKTKREAKSAEDAKDEANTEGVSWLEGLLMSEVAEFST